MVVGGEKRREKKRRKTYQIKADRTEKREKEKHLQRNDDGVDRLSKNNNSNKGERGGGKKITITKK